MGPDARAKESQIPLKSLVIVFSYHHNNTEKIAHAIARVLDAPVTTPQQVSPKEVAEYDLVGFGSGIYSATFDSSILALARRLPEANGKRAFLFSTYGAPAFAVNRDFLEKNHRQVREILQARGYTVMSEFACAGWNTNSFLKYFGGINKGRPDTGDLSNAEAFAKGLREMITQGTGSGNRVNSVSPQGRSW
jgi:flavodoxin